MFAKLKKKIAEEAATAPRSGVRIPRTISKESITSLGADSGDDFVSTLEAHISFQAVTCFLCITKQSVDDLLLRLSTFLV